MLSNIFGVIKGFFTAGFWLGSFLPVALAVALQGVLAAQVFPHFSAIELLQGSGASASKSMLLFLGLIVAAYAATPLLPWLQGILSGALLPGWLHDEMRKERAAHLDTVRAKMRDNVLLLGRFKVLLSKQAAIFREARVVGERTAARTPINIKTAVDRTEALKKAVLRSALPDLTQLTDTCAAVTLALKTNSAEESSALDNSHRTVLNIMQKAVINSEHYAESYSERNGGDLDLLNPQATRLADVRQLVKSYCANNYCADFDFLWPRLQLVLPEKGAFVERLNSYQAQSDFSILSLALLGMSAVVWLPILAIHSASPWTFCLLAALTPVVAAILYGNAVKSESELGKWTMAVIDRYRFDTLRLVLHHALPATLEAERLMWEEIARVQISGIGQNTSYKYQVL